jgi:hypothetical protein
LCVCGGIDFCPSMLKASDAQVPYLKYEYIAIAYSIYMSSCVLEILSRLLIMSDTM